MSLWRRVGDPLPAPAMCHGAPTERHSMKTETAGPPQMASHSEDFAELSRAVRDRGLLPRRRGYYTTKIATTVGALGVLIVAAIVVGNSWWNIAVAVGLAFVLAQLGFIGHDAGHRQICARRRNNDLVGLVVANLFTGFSFGWWLTKHNRHHAHTNRPGKDPDMMPGVLVYMPEQATALGPVGPVLASARPSFWCPCSSSRHSTCTWPA